MTDPRPEAERLVRALFEAFARRDVAALEPLVHPKASFWPEGTATQARRTEPYRGLAGLREYFADVEQVWERLRVEPSELRLAGGGVVAFGTAIGRTRGGQDVEVPVIWVFQVREGRVGFARVVRTAAEALQVAAER